VFFSAASTPTSPRSISTTCLLFPNTNTPIPLTTPLSDFEVPLERIEQAAGWRFFTKLYAEENKNNGEGLQLVRSEKYRNAHITNLIKDLNIQTLKPYTPVTPINSID
jgi:DNA/RNA endonuclease G (NUC1)